MSADPIEDEVLADADAAARELPPDDQLRRLSDLAQQVRGADEDIAERERKLKEAKERRRKLVEEKVPEVMHQLGMESFTLTDGTKVELKPEVYASVPKDTLPQALAWFRENGYGDLIKNTVTVRFGMNEDDEARRLTQNLFQQGRDYAQEAKILPQTLKAWVRERDAHGEEVPEHLLNVHRVTKAILK